MAEVDVGNEILCPTGEELVRGCEVPGDAAGVTIAIGRSAGDSQPGRMTTRAMEDEVVKGVGGPATGARKLVQGDVGPEPGHVIRSERVADGKLESGGGGVPWVAWHAPSHVGVLVSGNSHRPEGVVGAIGGVDEGVLIGPGGSARGGAVFRLPVLSPKGKGVLPSDGLRMRCRLNLVKGSAGGEAASCERLEPCRVVRDPEPLRW